MTPQERADELVRLVNASRSVLRAEGFLTFSDVHRRIEELAGRPVWTHELAMPESIVAEILSGEHPTMERIIEKMKELNPDVPVIVVAEAIRARGEEPAK